MSKTHLPAARESFESLKQTNEHGAECWSARKLQPLLGYSQWRRFRCHIFRVQKVHYSVCDLQLIMQ